MVIQMTNDENIVQIFMNTEEIGKNKCIPLSDKDYDKIKDYGDVMITITRNNTKAPLGIP
jgi:phosphoheptose isomerase